MAHKHDHRDHHQGHSHHHGHGHHHHAGRTASTTWMLAIGITLIFAVIEAIGGWWSGSLALLGDAGHMFSDTLALGIAGFAAWIALRPPSKKHSYGLGRAEIIAAWLSSLTMLIICIAVIAEAVTRFHHPQAVQAPMVIVIAFFGLLANGFVAWLLTRGEQTINVRAALIHVMGDLLGSIAALISGVVIYKTGWYLIDPILSIVIGILILISSVQVFRESLLILMEGVPPHINIEIVSKKINQQPGVKAIHDLHIWTLSSGRFALSAHIHIHELSSWNVILQEIKNILRKEFRITHITLQPEPEIMDCQPCKEP